MPAQYSSANGCMHQQSHAEEFKGLRMASEVLLSSHRVACLDPPVYSLQHRNVQDRMIME